VAGDRSIRFLLNDDEVVTRTAAGTTALDYLRRDRGLCGTKEGCREGECGACAILLGRVDESGALSYQAIASCLLPVAELDGTHVVTIEGLGPGLTPVQQAILDRHACQCGFCTPGIVMALTGFFGSCPDLTLEGALDALDGNICRCTGYVAIRDAASALVSEQAPRVPRQDSRVEQLVDMGMLPPSCLGAAARLQEWADQARAEPRGAHLPIVAGATDLYVQKPEALEEEPRLRLVSRMPRARGIRVAAGRLVVGAATTVEELRQSRELARAMVDIAAVLKGDLALVASAPMRNRATLGGNVANASPIGDLSIILLALQARLRLAGPRGRRTVALSAFFRAYKDVDLADDELIQAFEIPIPAPGTLFHFEKVSRRRILDIASVNSAIAVLAADGRVARIAIAAGGVAPVPLLLTRASEYLVGRSIDAETVRRAAGIAVGETAPISDVRGSADYKKLLLRQQVYAHFLTLFPDRVSAEALIGGVA
jgi:xanthine dehydrogenase small subunit